MKKLEQWVSRGRAVARSIRARAPGAARSHRPVRLVLRLNDVGLAPGLVRATGAPLGLPQWRDALVHAHQWLGPVRVCIAGGEPARSPLLEEVLRFANRLECPTHLVTAGPIDEDAAMALVDRGLGAVTVLVAGVDDGTHQATLGRPLSDATSTVESFRRARADRERPIQLLVGVPLSSSNIGSVGAIAGWARQSGVDGILATLPLGVEPPAGALEALDALGRDDLTPDHLRDVLAGRDSGVHGGLRMEILSDGTVLASSHVAPLGTLRQVPDPKDIWEAADEQIQVARKHPRPWDEVELVPQRLFSIR
jgi:hypothetical protein